MKRSRSAELPACVQPRPSGKAWVLCGCSHADVCAMRKPLLYPLSYEGLRPISYLPADSHECPVVPTVTIRCHPRRVGSGSTAGGGTHGAFSAVCDPACPGGIGQAPALPPRRRLTEHPPGRLRPLRSLDLRERRRDGSCTGTARCASCGSIAGAPHAQGAPARGLSPSAVASPLLGRSGRGVEGSAVHC